MTLNDIVVRVKERSHRGDINVTNDDITASIIRAVNDARRELVRHIPKYYFRATASISVTSPTVIYSLAADLQELLILHYTFNSVEYILTRILSEREFYENLYIFTQSVNRPYFYVDLGQDNNKQKQIQIYPTPDTNGPYTVNYTYYKDPTMVELTVLDLATEIPDFPSFTQDPLWKGALYHFLKSFDDAQGMAIAKIDYDAATLAIDESEDEDMDVELSWRWGYARFPYNDPVTGIRLNP